MYDLVEENNWKTLNGNSKYSKDYIKINNMLDEIQLKCESILKDNKYNEFNYNECEEFKRWKKILKRKQPSFLTGSRTHQILLNKIS